MRELGRHVIVDAWGAEANLLDDPRRLREILVEAVKATGATVLSSDYHKFQPQGVTAWVILAESHATLHTYPEHEAWMADVFTCGDVDPDAAAVLLIQSLGGQARIHRLSRG
jgi:S-adenosylmethionine decarboxylase